MMHFLKFFRNMNTQEIQMNGFVYEVTWIHSGQYHAYGDTYRVAKIKTKDTNPNSILEIMKIFYRENVPLKKDWDNKRKTMSEYFAGWCTVEAIPEGFKYVKCEPYDD